MGRKVAQRRLRRARHGDGTAAAGAAAAPTPIAPGDAGRGRLLVVATPIGNLGDLTPRAREAFAAADLVACEDTRRTGLLLTGLGLHKPLLSLHEHNEHARLAMLRERLAEGQTIALASDAGTPLLSDPGFLLVREAAAAGARVEPVPGASALLAALVVAGLPPSPFTFAGFPPPRTLRRRRFLAGLAALPHTLVLYEAPHRILATLADAVETLGDRPAALCRELTKLHEETLRGTLGEIRATLAARDAIRGEIVLVVAGAVREEGEETDSATAQDAEDSDEPVTEARP